MLRRLWKGSGCFMVVLSMFLLQACGDSSDLAGTGTAAAPQPAMNPAVLDSAAAFLAAATGKENPIGIDQVVFLNTVLGINQPLLTAVMQASDKADGSMGCLYGDLWVTLRDENGVPIPDAQGCDQPIAARPIELPLLDESGEPIVDGEGNPLTYFSDTVPMILSEYMDGAFKCEVDPAYVDHTIPVEMGRLNMVRASIKNPDTMARAFEEAMKNINASVEIKADLSGRLILVSEQEELDLDGNVVATKLVEATIDSPRENLALYRALLVEGRLVGYGVERIGEEGERIPAPWLEIRPDLELGDLAYLREGTPGRDGGVGHINGYTDLTVVQHSTEADYSGQFTDYVQYHPAIVPEPVDYCPYTDENDEVWPRVFASDGYQGENIRGFAMHADDARRMIVFMHKIIQDVADDGIIPALPAAEQIAFGTHANIPEVNGANPQPRRHLLMEMAAGFLAGASGKQIPITVDSVEFINTVLGLNDVSFANRGDLFGDLWILQRDEDGVPLRDDLGCVRPVASEPIVMTVLDENGNPVELVTDTVPMMLEEYKDGLYKCAVVPGYEDYVMEVEMARLNCVRSFISNPDKMYKHLHEAMKTINSSVMLKRDLAGRLVYTMPVRDELGQPVLDESGNPVLKDHTIDSPMENLALYRALLAWGKLEGTIELKIEGSKQTVELAIADTVDLQTHGMQFLKDGDETGQGLGLHQPSGYADFSNFSHSSRADFIGVPVDYVERSAAGCPYYDVSGDDVWTRILKGGPDDDETVSSNVAAFVAHAEDARKIIVFTHNIIQEPLP